MRARDGAVDKEEEKKKRTRRRFSEQNNCTKSKEKASSPNRKRCDRRDFFFYLFFFCYSTKPKMQSEAIASRWGDAKKAPDQNIKTIEKKKSGQAPLRR